MHTYHCSSASSPDYNANYAGYARSDYAGVHGGALRRVSNSLHEPGNGVFGKNSGVRLMDIKDGTEFTFLAGERSMTFAGEYGAIWMRSINERGDAGDGTSVTGICHREIRPNDEAQPSGFLSWHPGGAQFVMVDGSVHFISDQIAGTTYESLAQIQDGAQITTADLANAIR